MRITVSKVHIESTKLVNIYESSLGLYRRYCIVTMKCLQCILFTKGIAVIALHFMEHSEII